MMIFHLIHSSVENKKRKNIKLRLRLLCLGLSRRYFHSEKKNQSTDSTDSRVQ